MGAKGLLAVAGFAAGYLVGTRRGRKDYEQLKHSAANFVNDPRVQKWLSEGQQFASDKVPVVGDSVASAIGAVRDAARENADGGSGGAGGSASAGSTSGGATGFGTTSGGTTSGGTTSSGTSSSGTSGSGSASGGTTSG